MTGVEKLVELGAAIYVETVQRRRRAPVLAVVLLVVALVILLVAIGFLLAAGYVALLPHMRPLFACLVMAAALVVIAFCVLLWARWSFESRAEPAGPSRPIFDQEASEFLGKVSDEIQAGDGNSVLEGLVSAFALGFAKGLKRSTDRD
jgi:membrane protein implicated in regulation of membrane protease activity